MPEDDIKDVLKYPHDEIEGEVDQMYADFWYGVFEKPIELVGS